MRFLKVLFWLLLGGVVTAFISANGEERVSLHLWGGLFADFSLPFLLILIFLAGLLPMLLAYHAYKWRTRQRVLGLERALADLRAITPVPEAADPDADPYPAMPAPPLLPGAA